MKTLYLDLETYSTVPINHGTHAYAEQAEVLLFAWAIDDGPVSVWDCTDAKAQAPAQVVLALENPDVLVCAHNSHFDRTVLRHAMPRLCPPVTRWRDTMVKALAHGLPGALGDLCDVLKVPTDKAKDKAGKQLIHLFCKPRPEGSKIKRATSQSHPVEWARFVKYAASDIESMRVIDSRLPDWNYKGDELALWHLDQTINDRGVAIDLDLAHAAIRAVEMEQKVLARRTQELTDGTVQAATQRDAMLAFVLDEYGVQLPDMQQSTLERRVADPDLPLELRDLLAVRLQASTTSTSKYRTLARGTSSDGRLRGTLQFCGASRTGRWAGRLFQPQNLPRPTLKQKDIDAGVDALKADCADLVASNVMALTSSAIRGAIVAPGGKKLVIADLSNIEGRVLAWLAGEDWKLQAFYDYDTIVGHDAKGKAIRKGHDLYKLAYASSFGVAPQDVDDKQRQIGKVQELALGYEGGVGAFITFSLAYGIDLEVMAAAAAASIPKDVAQEALRAFEWAEKSNRTFGLSKQAYVVCDSFKRLWRNAHPQTSTWWKQLEETVRAAIMQPGRTLTSRRLKVRRDGSWLRIGLPSGRALCYPSPQVDDQGRVSYMGVNQYSRKWSRLATYGGKLVENVTQAVARDVLASAMPAIETQGYQIVLSVHDELLTETPDTNDYSSDQLAALMSTNPQWAQGLPLSAAGFETYRYRKD